MDRRAERLRLLAWLVLGFQLGATAWIGASTWEQWKPSTWRTPPSSPAVRQEKMNNFAFSVLSRCQASVHSAVDAFGWRRAESTCLLAVSKNPQSDEAAKLLADSRRELVCAEAFERANDMLQLRLFDAAASALYRYDPACQDATQARSVLVMALGEAERTARTNCLTAAAGERWAEAVVQCAAAMDQRCFSMSAREFEPPRGHALSLWGKVPKNGWRPADAVFLALRRAEDKEQVPAWSCRVKPALLGQTTFPDGYDSVRRRYRERFSDPYLALAVERYHSGELDEARKVLREHVALAGSKCESLTEVNAVNAAIANAQLGYRAGLDKLTDGSLEEAAGHFRVALKSDEQVVLTEAERGLPAADKDQLLRATPTHLRESIVESMHRRSDARGNELTEKGDLEGACAAWRLGLSFGPHVDLDEAVKVSCASR